jgi:hypothetical protein
VNILFFKLIYCRVLFLPVGGQATLRAAAGRAHRRSVWAQAQGGGGQPNLFDYFEFSLDHFDADLLLNLVGLSLYPSQNFKKFFTGTLNLKVTEKAQSTVFLLRKWT